MLVHTEYCGVCGKFAKFCIVDGAVLLREAVCEHCGASVRNSDVAREIACAVRGKPSNRSGLANSSLAEVLPNMSNLRILEAAAYGPIHTLLRTLPNYVCFEYLDGVAPGSYAGEIRCEDLQGLTFEDDTFDLVISQDVLEHVEDTDKSFSEITRVLKTGGKHVFSVPYHPLAKTESRKLKREVYHGDPNRRQGALVHTDWGNDITTIIDRFGTCTKRIDSHVFHQDQDISNLDLEYDNYLRLPPLDYYRYNSVVFVSEKISKSGFAGILQRVWSMFRH